MSRRIVAVTAGLSSPSSTRLLADRLADAVRTQVSARGEAAEVEVIELRDLAVPIANAMVSGSATPELDAARRAVTEADGVIAVTPVFAASYAGLFKSFMDLLDPDAMAGQPVLIGAAAGTARHSLVLDHALRPLFTYLRAVVVPTGVFAATEDFGSSEPGLDSRIGRAAAELAALVVRSPEAVAGFVPTTDAPRRSSGLDVDADVTPFSQLLRGHDGS